MKIRPVAKWYDAWVGMYWDSRKRRLYVLPLPMLGLYIEFGEHVEMGLPAAEGGRAQIRERVDRWLHEEDEE